MTRDVSDAFSWWFEALGEEMQNEIQDELESVAFTSATHIEEAAVKLVALGMPGEDVDALKHFLVRMIHDHICDGHRLVTQTHWVWNRGAVCLEK